MRKKNSGNALWFILLAIFLLGGLTVLLSRTGSNTEETGSAEKLSIEANEMLKYMGGIRTSVEELRQRGCSENQINFNTAPLSDYSNASAPLDKSCDVFDVAGGGQTYKAPSAVWLNSSKSAMSEYGHYMFVKLCILDVGTLNNGSCTPVSSNLSKLDVVMTVSYIKKDLCLKLNNMLQVSNTSGNPPQDLGFNHTADRKFIGVFNTSTHIIGNDAGAEPLIGKKSACYYDSDADFYTFYTTLMAR